MSNICSIRNALNTGLPDYYKIQIPDQMHPRVPEKRTNVIAQFKQPIVQSVTWLESDRYRALILDGGKEEDRLDLLSFVFSHMNWPLYVPKPGEDLKKAVQQAYREGSVFFYSANLLFKYGPAIETFKLLNFMDEILIEISDDREILETSNFGIVLSGYSSHISYHPIAQRARKIDLYYNRPLLSIAM